MNLENLELCKACGGACCKSMGCHYSPSDFKDLTYEGLKKQIDKGHISIDWWEGNPFEDERDIDKAFFLRIKNIGAPVIDPSYGGVCSLLTKDGCPLSFEDRPKGGKTLIPSKEGCVIFYSKDDCAKEWYKYNKVLKRLYNHYSTEKFKNAIIFKDKSLEEQCSSMLEALLFGKMIMRDEDGVIYGDNEIALALPMLVGTLNELTTISVKKDKEKGIDYIVIDKRKQ